jgi:hypothetical protein
MQDSLVVGGSTIAFLHTEVAKKLFGPLAEQLGLSLGDVGGIYREFQNRNLAKIFGKVGIAREHKPSITQNEFQRIVPLLQLASVQGEEELQKRWAVLLDSTISDPRGMLPSFGQTLSQINADEAQFLDRLFVAASAITESNMMVGHQPGEMIYDDLISVYDPALSRPPSYPFIEGPYVDNRDPELMAHADLLIDDLVRLGIIGVRVDAVSSGGDDDLTDTTTFNWYSVSAYGRQFIKAVSPRDSGEASDLCN